MKRPSEKKHKQWLLDNPAPKINHDPKSCKDMNRRPGTPPWGCDCPGSFEFSMWCRRHWEFLGIMSTPTKGGNLK